MPSKSTASGLTAQKLRLLLIGSILLLIILSVAIFVYARSVLSGYAADVQKVSATAASSSKNLSELSILKKKLANDQEAVTRAKNLVAESRSYAYQDQIIRDINTFATKSGVLVTGYQFNSEGAATGTAPTASATTPAAGATGMTGATPSASGLKTVSVAVSLKSPMKYESVMNMVHMIEQNLTKMQLQGITLSKDSTSNNVTVSSLTIEVYVR